MIGKVLTSYSTGLKSLKYVRDNSTGRVRSIKTDGKQEGNTTTILETEARPPSTPVIFLVAHASEEEWST
jgi:hypothetical protein